VPWLGSGVLLALTLLSQPPPPHAALSLSTPIPFLQDQSCFAGTPDPRKHCSLTSSQGYSSALACLQLPINTGQSSLKVLSLSEYFLHAELWSLSHFLEILVLGLGSLLSLGTGFPSRDCEPLWWRHSLWVLHISLSLEDLIFQGCLPYLSSGQASPWELDHPKFLQTPHWDVFWPILGPYASHLILSPKSSL
jgi:hypothetical protein